MRYEAKHRYFKKLAQSIGSYKNCAYTLAYRHQLQQAHNLIVGKMFSDRLEVGPGSSKNSCFLRKEMRALIETDTVDLIAWLKVNSTKYKKGAYLLLDFEEAYPSNKQSGEFFLKVN